MTVSKRQLAARFVEALGFRPVAELAEGLIAAAAQAGYTSRDLESLVAAVETELRRQYGAVEVALTTAHQLPEASLSQIAAAVATAAGARQHSYTTTVDPELLGGYEAKAGGLAVHNSIRFNLTNSGGNLG